MRANKGTHWLPYLVPRDQLAERLMGGPPAPQAVWNEPTPELEPSERHNGWLGFLGEQEVIRRLTENPRLDLFRPFPDLEMVEAFERRRDDYQDYGLVFCAPDGTPYDPDSASRRFQSLVVACGQKRIRLHDTRHTHATLLLEAGEAMDYVADRLGDRLDTVAKVYAHLTRRRRDGGVVRWAALKRARPVAVAVTGN